jgi:hypothetical protein
MTFLGQILLKQRVVQPAVLQEIREQITSLNQPVFRPLLPNTEPRVDAREKHPARQEMRIWEPYHRKSEQPMFYTDLPNSVADFRY